MHRFVRSFGMAAFGWLAIQAGASAADQPQWGQPESFNMVSAEKNLPIDFDPGQKNPKTGEIDPATTRNVKWTARLGNQTYGTPVVAGGKVFVGTNNEAPRDERIQGDRGVLMCFDDATGRFLWQLVVPKLSRIKWADWRYIGITSPPVVEGNRAYLISNRGEVLCLDTEGMANGNDGPVVDENRLLAVEDMPPLDPGPYDADIVWRFDMVDRTGAEPHNAASGSVLVVGNLLYVCTANGVEWTHDHIVNPQAPSVIVLDKRTGKLVAKDNFGIGPDIIHGQWSSPSLGRSNGRTLGFYASGSGVLYAFEPFNVATAGPLPALLKTPNTTAGVPRDNAGQPSVLLGALKNVWRFNGHPLAQTQDVVPIDHQHDSTSYEVIGIPVFHQGYVYTIFTQEPYHRMKQGRLVCVKVDGSGDVTRSAIVWSYDAIGSSSSTVSVADGLVYAAGFDGRIHCLDALTGKLYWVHETNSPIWASTMVADGKVYVGTGKSTLWILEAGKQLKVINRIRLPDILHTTPVAANGKLYLATYKNLFVVKGK
jgi:outer membrane protein assembly factor BamB